MRYAQGAGLARAVFDTAQRGQQALDVPCWVGDVQLRGLGDVVKVQTQLIGVVTLVLLRPVRLWVVRLRARSNDGVVPDLFLRQYRAPHAGIVDARTGRSACVQQAQVPVPRGLRTNPQSKGPTYNGASVYTPSAHRKTNAPGTGLITGFMSYSSNKLNQAGLPALRPRGRRSTRSLRVERECAVTLGPHSADDVPSHAVSPVGGDNLTVLGVVHQAALGVTVFHRLR
jgi:hypothetical protein